MDGVFNLKDGHVELVDGPKETREVFRLLQAVIEQSRARGDKPEQTLAAIKEASPEAASLLSRILTRENIRDASSLVSTIASVVGVVLALKGTPSEADIRRIARDEVRAEQIVQRPAPQILKGQTNAEPQAHGSDSAQRIPNSQYEPQKHKGPYKQRAKRKR